MGVSVISSFEKKGKGDFHLVLEKDVKGGFRTVITLADRDAIPEWARSPGMKVSVVAEGFKEWRLGTNTTIAAQVWTLVDKAIDALTPADIGVTIPPLNPVSGKIDTEYLPNVFLNDVYPVETVAEMLELNTVTGNAVIVANTGDGTGATYFKINNTNPATLSDFIVILFPGAVTKVNEQTGIVTITLAGLLGMEGGLTAFQQAVSDAPIISNINTSLAQYGDAITLIQQKTVSLQQQIDAIVLSQDRAGVGIEIYTDKEWSSGKYVEYESNGSAKIYRAIQDVPEGTLPTNSDYWKVIAGGSTTASIQEQIAGLEENKASTPKGVDAVIKDRVVNNLTSTFTDRPVSALQAKLLQDNKLSSRTSSYISVQTDNNVTMEQALIVARAATPNNTIKSATNRFSIYVYAGDYLVDELLLDEEFVDIIGVGPRESIRFIGNESGNVFFQTANDIRLDNFTIVGSSATATNSTDKTIFRNLISGVWYSDNYSYDSAFLGTYENIIGNDGIYGLFAGGDIRSGVYRNIQIANNIGLYVTDGGIAENCILSGFGSNCEITNCYISIISNSTIEVENVKIKHSIIEKIITGNTKWPIISPSNCELSYVRIIHNGIESNLPLDLSPYVIWSGIYPPNTGEIFNKIHHCTIEFVGTVNETTVEGIAIDPLITNLIPNGQNSWDQIELSGGLGDIDGGSAESVYLNTQVIDGGQA